MIENRHDLRTGNWLQWHSDGNYFKVVGIWKRTILQLNETGFTFLKVKDFSGILLTPEILEDIGFISYDNPNNTRSIIYALNDFKLISVGETAFTLRDYPYIRTIKYVHELQNLYFALTGLELKFYLNVEVNERSK